MDSTEPGGTGRSLVPAGRPGLMMGALNWAYDRALEGFAGVSGVEEFAESYRRRGESCEKAVRSMIRWQAANAGAVGFVLNSGGLITLPVALPANVASALIIQIRLIAGIARLAGHDVHDDRVRTLVFVCLAGSGATKLLQEAGVVAGRTLATQLSAAVLARLNTGVGAQLAAQAGGAGAVNLARLIPLVGGLVGGGVDAAVTLGIGAVARRVFPCHPSKEPKALPAPAAPP